MRTKSEMNDLSKTDKRLLSMELNRFFCTHLILRMWQMSTDLSVITTISGGVWTPSCQR